MSSGMNLLYIFADQWRRDAIGIYDKHVITPNLDAFAKESAVFDRAYSSCPLCSPHRGSLFSGKHPVATNVFTNCKPGVESFLREEDICVSDVLKSEGYHTGYIGKWHLDKPDGSGGWDAYTPPGRKRHGFDFWYSYGACDEHMSPHYWDTEGNRLEIKQWSPEHETQVALDFLEANQEEKFALFLSYNPPHSPYDETPDKYQAIYENSTDELAKKEAYVSAPEGVGDPLSCTREEFDRKMLPGYYGAVSGLDENIGRILNWMKDRGLYEKTYIVISADHGDMLGEHDRVAKHIWYEGAVGIPLIVGGGDLQPMRTDELLGSADQTATLLGLLGLPVPEEMQGKDFSPLLRGEAFTGYDSVMTAAFPNTPERIAEFERLGENFLDYGWRSIVTKDYKLAVNRGMDYGMEPEVYLYDLQKDTNENECIENKPVQEVLLGELEKWCEAAGDGFYRGLAEAIQHNPVMEKLCRETEKSGTSRIMSV